MSTKQAAASIAGIALLLACCARADSQTRVSPGAPPARVRSFNFSYHADIPISNPSAKKLEAWIPLPRDDPFQQVRDLKIDTPAHFEIVDQSSNGNRVAHLEASAPLPASIPLTVTFAITRREEAVNMMTAAGDIPEPTDGRFAAYLKPDRLVRLTGRIAQVSANLAETNVSPLQQARVDYEYVTSIMKYDKSGTGWGRGDALYACDVRRGNCTDFHSLFIALVRARGIPARFTIGFPLGAAKSGDIPGYHCWAEFYAGGVWVPVDASEAWKHPRPARLLFRASRCGPRRIHDGPRYRDEASAEWRAAQLPDLSVRRARRGAGAAKGNQDEVFLRGRVELRSA